MSDSPVQWFPADTRNIIANPTGRPLADIVDAIATLDAVKKAADDLASDLRAEVRDQAESRREHDGGRWKGIGTDRSQAFDTWTRPQFVVADHGAARVWLAEHHPDVVGAVSFVSDRYEVNGPAFESLLLELQHSEVDPDPLDVRDELRQIVVSVEEATVDVDAMLDMKPPRFVVGGDRIVDLDGQPVPGVTVVPSRFKQVTVRPDGRYVDGVRAMIAHAIKTRGDE